MARNAKLVYGRMTGWGQTGPLAQAAGHRGGVGQGQMGSALMGSLQILCFFYFWGTSVNLLV